MMSMFIMGRKIPWVSVNDFVTCTVEVADHSNWVVILGLPFAHQVHRKYLIFNKNTMFHS